MQNMFLFTTNTKINWRNKLEQQTTLKCFICGKRNIQVKIGLKVCPRISSKSGNFKVDHPIFYLVLQSGASLQDYLYFMFTFSSTLFYFCQSIIVLNYLLYLNLCLLLLSYKNRDSLFVLTLHIIRRAHKTVLFVFKDSINNKWDSNTKTDYKTDLLKSLLITIWQKRWEHLII